MNIQLLQLSFFITIGELNLKTQLTFGTTEALTIMCTEECLSVPLE
jgi:hypothetical protein